MFEGFKESLHEFRQAAPGERFKERYYRRRKTKRSIAQKLLYIGGGLLLFAAGIVFLFIPGPGTIILLIGSGLIAQESLPGARTLDWAELRIRKVIQVLIQAWRRAPVLGKLLFITLGLILAGGAAAGTYFVFFAGQ